MNISPRSASAAEIRSGVEREPEADVLGQRRLDLVDEFPERAGERHAAQHLEALVGTREVRLGVLDDAAERLQRRAALFEDGRDGGVDRQATDMAAPGDPETLRIEVQVGHGERLADRERIARVRPGEHREQQRGVGRRARDRPEHGQRIPGIAWPGVRNPAGGGA